jgi:hypothetical protein
VSTDRSTCSDCRAEGVSPPRPKEVNNYCRPHAYARNRKSRRQKSTRKEVIFGFWSLLTQKSTSVVANSLQDFAFPPRRLKPDVERTVRVSWLRGLAEAFEYRCVLEAVSLGRILDMAEEDVIIDDFYGSRNGVPMPKLVSDTLTDRFDGTFASPDIPVGTRMRLPDPTTRRHFRATGLGGPTTNGEPTFLKYYEQEFGHEAPPEMRLTYQQMNLRLLGSLSRHDWGEPKPVEQPADAKQSQAVTEAVVLVRGTIEAAFLAGAKLTSEQTSKLRAVITREYAREPWTVSEVSDTDTGIQNRLIVAVQEAGAIQLRPPGWEETDLGGEE